MSTFNISTGLDDGEWDSAGLNFDTNNTYISIGKIGGNSNQGFCTFNNITIPKGATITSAILTVKAKVSNSLNTLNVNIYMNNADSAVSPTNFTMASGLALTTAHTFWSLTSWTINTNYDTPDFSASVQEVINRSGWSSGQNMMVIFNLDYNSSLNGRDRQFYTYDSSPSNAPILQITYTAPAPVNSNFFSFF